MFTVTKVQTIASTVRGHHAWSPYIGEKSCHFNLRAITFTTPTLWPSSRTAILSVMNHGVEEWQQGDLYRRRQVWLLDLHVRRSAKLRKCRLDIPEDAHQGGAIASQTTLCRNLGKKRGRRIFEGGVLAGHYGVRVLISVLHVGVRH